MAAGVGAMEKLEEKLSLCCLMELVFKTPSAERTLSFATVAAATGLAEANVELVLMHALALELIKVRDLKTTVHFHFVCVRILLTNI